MNKYIFVRVTIFCIAVSSSFYLGQHAGRENLTQCQSELLQARQELKTTLSMEIARKTHIEWLKQREDAFREVIAIEMAEDEK